MRAGVRCSAACSSCPCSSSWSCLAWPSRSSGLDNPGIALAADKVFPHMVTSLLPVGVIGLVLAGLIAAIMSSIDSTLNSASALITLDFIKPSKPNLSEADVLKYGRVSMFVIMVVSALWAPKIAQFDGLFKYIQ